MKRDTTITVIDSPLALDDILPYIDWTQCLGLSYCIGHHPSGQAIVSLVAPLVAPEKSD